MPKMTTLVLLQLLHLAGATRQRPALSAADALAERAHGFVRETWRQLRDSREVARALDVSTDYLRHAFRQRFRMTLHDLLTQLRIEHAQYLLGNSVVPQKAIVTICGFADVQQFSRRFSQVVGVAPGAYRKRLAGRLACGKIKP